VLAEAEARNLPVLAICFGIQVLNVSRGGTLIQDLESQVEDCIKHEQGKPAARASHNIRLENDGMLFEIARELSAGERVKVNSHHHQAVKTVGENLKAVAWANDGVIECIQDTRPGRFVLGVQWHPELSWEADELSRLIFGVFVSRCSESRSNSLVA
jgi:putative glutamine amidotransferase